MRQLNKGGMDVPFPIVDAPPSQESGEQRQEGGFCSEIERERILCQNR